MVYKLLENVDVLETKREEQEEVEVLSTSVTAMMLFVPARNDERPFHLREASTLSGRPPCQ